MPPLHDRPEADRPENPEAEAEDELQTDTTSGGQGQSGWSGRAVGPLSGLLPGGPGLDAGEVPVAASAAVAAVGDAQAATQAPGDDEPAASAIAAAGDHEPAVPDAPDEPPAGEASRLPQLDETAEAAQPSEADLTATDDRWHAALAAFVDNPRASVAAARTLIDEDIAVLIALLARRKEAMHALWPAEKDADTEALRVALVNYRDLRNRLADVITALTA